MTEPMPQSLMYGIGAGSAQAVLEHAGNPYYAKALRANPAYERALALRDKAFRTRADHALSRPHGPALPVTVDDDIDEWLTTAAATAAAESEWAAKDQALAALVARCDSNIQGVGMDRDAILHSLHDDLDELMARVSTAVDRLGGAHTPSEVIAAGVGDAWNELAALRTEYDEVRAAQDMAMIGADSEMASARSNYLWEDPMASDTQIANLDKTFPGWRDKASTTFTTAAPSWDGRPQPWPADPVGQLVWIATSGARTWIPTIGQLNALWTKRRRNANPMPNNMIAGRPDNKPLNNVTIGGN
jgi:hypothetical protein